MDQSIIKFFRKGTQDVCLNGFDIEDEPGMIHCLPISGGADSSALAVLLHEKFPHIDFKMVTTDTMAEEKETYEFLDLIENVTGKKIERIKPKHGLFELIEKYKGYLPSSQSRWCTRELKLVPFKKWISQFNGQPMTMYVGIRADESSRVAFSIEGVETVMPFKEMGWTRDNVFGYLSQTIGVPAPYQTRTRSGCSVCPFVRRQEVVGLLQRRPEEFERGMRYEKLSPEDELRHQPGIPLWKDSGIAPNWQSMPMPLTDEALDGKKIDSNDIFGARGLFVAGEFFLDAMPGDMPFTWHQRLISYSPTLAGIKRQVNDRYQHLLRTAEVYEMSPFEVRQKAKFAIWYVELDAAVFDTEGPRGKSYTWQSGQSYAMVRHITDWVMRVLHAEFMSRQASTPVKSELSVEYEWMQSAKEGVSAAQASGNPMGRVVASAWHQPKEEEPVLSAEEELALLPCPMCNI